MRVKIAGTAPGSRSVGAESAARAARNLLYAARIVSGVCPGRSIVTLQRPPDCERWNRAESIRTSACEANTLGKGIVTGVRGAFAPVARKIAPPTLLEGEGG